MGLRDKSVAALGKTRLGGTHEEVLRPSPSPALCAHNCSGNSGVRCGVVWWDERMQHPEVGPFGPKPSHSGLTPHLCAVLGLRRDPPQLQPLLCGGGRATPSLQEHARARAADRQDTAHRPAHPHSV
jgi:hypothetical protein